MLNHSVFKWLFREVTRKRLQSLLCGHCQIFLENFGHFFWDNLVFLTFGFGSSRNNLPSFLLLTRLLQIRQAYLVQLGWSWCGYICAQFFHTVKVFESWLWVCIWFEIWVIKRLITFQLTFWFVVIGDIWRWNLGEEVRWRVTILVALRLLDRLFFFLRNTRRWNRYLLL